ncbi:MAG: glycosyltransferase [Prevotellaceae bacterium]|nr:glycosyltransferase [Prevotellaceae bacterium]
MNVLFIASWYPTNVNPNFGIFIKEHAKAINTTGNSIVVLALVIHRDKSFFRKKTTDIIDENGVRTIRMEVFTRFRDIVYHFMPLQYRILRKQYKKTLSTSFEPDVIHSNVVFPAGIIGDRLARELRKKHIISEHWSGIERFAKIPLLAKQGYRAYKNADKILPVSDFLKSNIRKAFPGLSEKSFHIVPNVIESRFFHYKEDGNHPDEIRLCAVAGWNRTKNQAKQPELLIDAIACFQEKNRTGKSICLTLVGDGDKAEDLKKRCREKHVNVRFTGFLPKQALGKELQRSDFLVHATKIETFGVVVAEALLCGTPVICSNVGALPEFINESNGILCENTTESWVEAFMKAFATSYDHKKIAEEFVNRYALETIGKLIDEVYHPMSLVFSDDRD